MEKLISDALAFLTHEVRTALTSIKGYSELMYDSQQSTKGKFECLSKIQKNAKELEEFLESLSNLSEAEKGTVEIRSERFNVGAELFETFASLKAVCQKSRLGFELVPAVLPKLEVISDARRLREVILNTTMAIIEATPRGTVQVTVESSPDKLIFVIDSTKNSIPTIEVSRLIDPGINPDLTWDVTMKGKLELCLRFSQLFVRALGGDIGIEKSKFGLGSSFRISIPSGPKFDFSHFIQETPELCGTSELHFETVTGYPDLRGCRILVFEDDPDIQLLITYFLRKSKADITVVDNGIKGVEMAQVLNPNIIIMDIQIPGKNGFEATTELRRLGIGVPVIALTAHALSGVREKCLSSGCTSYLTKPFDASTLLYLIHHHFQKDLLKLEESKASESS